MHQYKNQFDEREGKKQLKIRNGKRCVEKKPNLYRCKLLDGKNISV